jgi:hypothetical protein
MPGNTEGQGGQNELGLVIADRGGHLVPSPGVAHPATGRTGLNESVLLGPEQHGENQRVIRPLSKKDWIPAYAGMTIHFHINR